MREGDRKIQNPDMIRKEASEVIVTEVEERTPSVGRVWWLQGSSHQIPKGGSVSHREPRGRSLKNRAAMLGGTGQD